MSDPLIAAALAGMLSGAAAALTAVRVQIAVRNRRTRMRRSRYHHGVRCPGHPAGSRGAALAVCPAATGTATREMRTW